MSKCIEFNRKAWSQLEEIGAREGREPATIVRKSLGLYSAMQKLFYGQKVTIIDENGKKYSYYFK